MQFIPTPRRNHGGAFSLVLLAARLSAATLRGMETHRFWRPPQLPFVESRCARDSAACYAPHTHPLLSVGAVDGGASMFSREGRRSRLLRGDVVLIPAGEVHCCNPEDAAAWSYQMLYLDPQWVAGVVGEMYAETLDELQPCVLTALPAHIRPPRLHAALTRLNRCLFSDMALADKEAALIEFVGGLFGARARSFTRAPRLTPTRLHEMQSLIDVRCDEALTLASLAEAAGMSRYHFVRAFRRAVGMTPHAWQLDARINRARGLLDDGMPLAEVALHLGFADQSHFQRTFKQRVAVTPRQYRRNFLQD
jgi:AraC-like DNA-binding protein